MDGLHTDGDSHKSKALIQFACSSCNQCTANISTFIRFMLYSLAVVPQTHTCQGCLNGYKIEHGAPFYMNLNLCFFMLNL